MHHHTVVAPRTLLDALDLLHETLEARKLSFDLQHVAWTLDSFLHLMLMTPGENGATIILLMLLIQLLLDLAHQWVLLRMHQRRHHWVLSLIQGCNWR